MRISDWSSYVCSSDLKTWKSGEKCDLARPLQHALCFSARPARPTWPGPRRQEEWTDGIRKALRPARDGASRSEEHTSELQSLMRNSYAVFCLKKQKITLY